MNTELVQTLTSTFEACAQQTEGGIEYWLARDLQQLLGYDEWRNFNAAISKAKTACEVSSHRVADHFVGVNKMVELGSGSQREIEVHPDQATLEKLIALGQCADDDPRIGDMLGSLKVNPYVCSIHPFQEFEWSRELSWADACAIVRAVVRTEAARLTQSGGSASAIKNACRTMEDRDRVAAMELSKIGLPSDLARRIRFERVVTPVDWERKVDIYRGATFNLAHSFSQMLHLRPQNRFEEFDGMYLVGGGTHHGSGLPVIFESARISSRLLLDDLN